MRDNLVLAVQERDRAVGFLLHRQAVERDREIDREAALRGAVLRDQSLDALRVLHIDEGLRTGAQRLHTVVNTRVSIRVRRFVALQLRFRQFLRPPEHDTRVDVRLHLERVYTQAGRNRGRSPASRSVARTQGEVVLHRLRRDRAVRLLREREVEVLPRTLVVLEPGRRRRCLRRHRAVRVRERARRLGA